MSKEEYDLLTIEEKALLMEYISTDDDFKIISSVALSKILRDTLEKID